MTRNYASLRLLFGVLLLLPFFLFACGGDETVVEKIVPTPPPTTGLIEGEDEKGEDLQRGLVLGELLQGLRCRRNGSLDPGWGRISPYSDLACYAAYH